jgi:hypothetical protein
VIVPATVPPKRIETFFILGVKFDKDEVEGIVEYSNES